MEQIEPSTSGRRRRQVKGRQDAEKQEKKIEMKKLVDRLDELVKLHNAQKEAGVEYSDAVKAAAEASGLQASVVRRFVAAKVGNNFDDRKRDAQQMALVFDEVKA